MNAGRFYQDLKTYSDDDIFRIAGFYKLKGDPDELRWYIAFKHSMLSANMFGGEQSMGYLTDGTFVEIDELREGQPFFRKYTDNLAELMIALTLLRHPHPNIVDIYNVTDEYYDMEMLDVSVESVDEKWFEEMSRAKEHLQSLGIAYIDWKPDNTGLSANGKLKLFDFDGSGITTSDGLWFQEPAHMYQYRQALEAGLTQPFEIDDYAFANPL